MSLSRLEPEASRSALRELGDGTERHELWAFLAHLGAQHALVFGSPPAALVRLERARAAHDEEQADGGVSRALVLRSMADLLIACGRGGRAKVLLDEHAAGTPLLGVPLCRSHLLRDDAAGARRVAERLVWDPATTTEDRLELLLLGALAAERDGASLDARVLMRQAADLAASTGLRRPFVTVPSDEVTALLDVLGDDVDRVFLAPALARAAVYPERLVTVELTEHERAVLTGLATLGSRQAIADSLSVSLNTVKTQLASVYQKLGTNSRQDTLAAAVDLGLLSAASIAE